MNQFPSINTELIQTLGLSRLSEPASRPLTSRRLADLFNRVTSLSDSHLRKASNQRPRIDIPQVLPREVGRLRHKKAKSQKASNCGTRRKCTFLTGTRGSRRASQVATTPKMKAPLMLLSVKQKKVLELVLGNDVEGLKSIAHTLAPADINGADENGNTPVYYSAQMSLQMTQVLVHLGARVNPHCEHGNTPLHAAFQSDRDDVISYLVKMGGNMTLLNKSKIDPMRCATPRICAKLGIEMGQSFSYSAQELIAKLKPKGSGGAKAGDKAGKQTKELVLYQFPKSVRGNRLFLRNSAVRRNSPLYPRTSLSKLRFQGDCLSPTPSTPRTILDE